MSKSIFVRSCLLCVPFALSVFGEDKSKECASCSVVDLGKASNQSQKTDYSNLVVKGLDRVSRDVVVNLLVFNKDSSLDIDESIKNIYKSGIFDNVKINAANSVITIIVKENPGIEKLRFEGNDSLKEEMLKSIINDRLAEGKMFNKSVIHDVVSDLQMAYRFNGFPAAKIDPKIIRREGNKVDLVIEIKEGDQALVSKIIFCGNNAYDKETLKEKIETKERATWRFLGKEVSLFGLEKSRIDSEALNRFYHNEGYIDFRTKKIIPELDFKKKNTYLTVMLHEGDRFKIRDVKIQSKSKRVSVTDIKCKMAVLSGDWYSKTMIDVNRIRILEDLSRKGHVFVDAKYDLNIDRKNKEIDVVYTISDSPRTYIERIEIEGNTRTEDNVIRRLFKFHEGDPNSPYEILKSKESLYATGFFSDVNIYTHNGSAPDRIILKVSVKESEDVSNISLACTAADQDGLGGMLAYTDNNFMGRGQTFSSDIQIAQKMVSGSVSLYEPRFIWDNVSAELEVGGAKRSRKRQEHSDYKDIHIMPSIIYNINRNLSHRLSVCMMFSRKVWVDREGRRHNTVPASATSETFLSDEYGAFTSSEISSTLTYRDSFKTKDGVSGYSISLRNAYSGITSNTSYFKNSLSAEYYVPCPMIDNRTSFVIKGNIAHINEIRNVKGVFRFQPGGDGTYFRGFDTVGPRDKVFGSCIGGINMWTTSLQLRRPISGSELGVFGSVFVDIGSVYGVTSKYKGLHRNVKDYDGQTRDNYVVDDSSPRISVGFAIEWKKCPLGSPLSFIFAAPIKKSSHDVRRSFAVGI